MPTPAPLTRAQLARLREVVEKMTAGEWRAANGGVPLPKRISRQFDEVPPHVWAETRDGLGRRVKHVAAECGTDEDVQGIAALRNAAEALIGQVEAAMEALRPMVQDYEQEPGCACHRCRALPNARALLAAYDAEGGSHG